MEKFSQRGSNAAFALNDFEQHGTTLIGYGAVQGRCIIQRNVLESSQKRREWFTIVRFPGGTERPKGPSVESAHGSDNTRSTSCEPGKFERGFDGFGAGIT